LFCRRGEEAKLTIFDIDFEKLYNELQPFCKDAYLDDDKDRKVMESYLDSKQKELDSFIDNDLFDSAAVGDDIDDKEFMKDFKPHLKESIIVMKRDKTPTITRKIQDDLTMHIESEIEEEKDRGEDLGWSDKN